MTPQSTAIRQAEFLQKLAALMNEYDAEFRMNMDCLNPYVEIWACGKWCEWHKRVSLFDVDRCIEATQETIKFAEALTP